MVKKLLAIRETWVWSLGQEDPLVKEMAAHSSVLAWKIPWTEEPGRLQSMGLQRLGYDWATSLTYLTPCGQTYVLLTTSSPLQAPVNWTHSYHILRWQSQNGHSLYVPSHSAQGCAYFGPSLGMPFPTLISAYKNLPSFLVNWRIIALQCCVGFCYTGISHNYIYIYIVMI